MSDSSDDFDPAPDENINVHVIAIGHFLRALKALDAATTEFEGNRATDASDLRKRSTELRRAMQDVLDERKRSDEHKSGKRSEEATGEPDVDFDVAREEIERRLARIRRTEDSG